MDEWSVTPVCLVQIKSIFSDLTVHGHKTFLVLAMLAALVPAIRSEVKHVPYVGCPQIWTLCKHF